MAFSLECWEGVGLEFIFLWSFGKELVWRLFLEFWEGVGIDILFNTKVQSHYVLLPPDSVISFLCEGGDHQPLKHEGEDDEHVGLSGTNAIHLIISISSCGKGNHLSQPQRTVNAYVVLELFQRTPC